VINIDYSNFDLETYWEFIENEKFSKPTTSSKNKTLLKYENQLFPNDTKSITFQEFYTFLQNNNNSFKKVFEIINVKKIILLEADKLNVFVQDIEKSIDSLTNDEQEKLRATLKDIFQYSKLQGKKLAPYFEKYLNPSTCYYCNIDFINRYGEEEIEKDGKKETVFKNKFTLDHFIDKGRYPYLALSIFNLVPCCFICNSKKIKGSIEFYGKKELEDTNPYLKSFQFDQKVKFKLYLTNSCKDLNIKAKDNIDIQLKEQYSNKYEDYIKVFRLNERYQAHKDIVFEMIKNTKLYPESRLKELQDLTGIPYQEIKKDIFKLIGDEVDLSKEPFSKLKRDMAYELGLI